MQGRLFVMIDELDEGQFTPVLDEIRTNYGIKTAVEEKLAKDAGIPPGYVIMRLPGRFHLIEQGVVLLGKDGPPVDLRDLDDYQRFQAIAKRRRAVARLYVAPEYADRDEELRREFRTYFKKEADSVTP